jgi:cytochrome c
MNLAVATVLAIVSIAANAAQGDGMSRGERLFRAHCFGCHSIACNRSGPKLQGVLGRRAGSLADFGAYSESLKRSGIVWSEQTLDQFLHDPGALVPGTWMSIVNIRDPSDRREIVDYVKRQDTSIDLCR